MMPVAKKIDRLLQALLRAAIFALVATCSLPDLGALAAEQKTAEAPKLQEALSQLNDLQKLWGSTRASAQETNAPALILQQIDATLTAIAAAQAKLNSERTALLDLQSQVAHEVNKCGTALAKIGQI